MEHSIILLLFIIPLAKSHCHSDFANACYDNQSAIVSNGCLFHDNEVTETLANDGYINVTFELKPHCNFTEYDITLLINEDVQSETACRIVENLKQVHTTISYKRITSNETRIPTCGHTATVTFQYVYTGCYKVRFQAKLSDVNNGNADSTIPVIKPQQYIETAYNKTLIQAPLVFADYREEGLNAGNFALWLNTAGQYKLTLEITIDNLVSFMANYGSVHSNQINKADDHLMVLKVKSPLFMCSTSIGLEFKCKHNCSGDSIRLRQYSIDCILPRMKERSECEVTGNRSNISCFMKNESVRSIECHVKNITTGNYSFKITIDHDSDVRCTSNTVWGGSNICQWDFIKEIKEQELATIAADTSRTKETEMYLYLSILVFVVIVLVAGAFILHKIRQKSKMQLSLLMHHVENGDSRLIDNPKILLLYARDDEKLMNTMTAFRDMLKQICKAEVYDIYDPRFDEDIAADPEEWIREKLSDESCKTVLILTKCGYLLSKQVTPSTYVYQHQQCYDTLFPYAMKILTQNLNCVSYTKLFIVNLNFDRNEYASFEFFNPYTRYRLPDNVDKLLSDLIDKQVDEVQNTTVYKLFLHEYKTLEEYQTTQSNHIENVLRVE